MRVLPLGTCHLLPDLPGRLPEFDGSWSGPARMVKLRPVPPHPGPLPHEGGNRSRCFGRSNRAGFAVSLAVILPLPKGEGRGEGEGTARSKQPGRIGPEAGSPPERL